MEIAVYVLVSAVAGWICRGAWVAYSSSTRARTIDRIKRDLKSLEAIKPDAAKAASDAAGEATKIADIKAEAASL